MCPTGNMWYIPPVKIFFPVGLRTLAYLVHGIFETEPNPVKQTKNLYALRHTAKGVFLASSDPCA